MYEVTASVIVGDNSCNANCKHCGGKINRGEGYNLNLLTEFLIDRYKSTARYFTISSGGEPTLFPNEITSILEIVNNLSNINMKYSQVNLYSNGIKFGEKETYCKKYLPLWKSLGLTHIYLTVHDLDSKKNAEIYGIENYPKLDDIIFRISNNDIKIRANIILSKNIVSTLENFKILVDGLYKKGISEISAWPIRGRDGKVNINELPLDYELIKNYADTRGISFAKLKNRQTLFSKDNISDTWCN